MPWTASLEQIRAEFGVVLIGWPMGSQFRDPSRLEMWEIRVLMSRVDRGTCHFQRVGKCDEGSAVVEILKRGATKQEGGRNDRNTCRGRQAHPAKPRCKGKTGKIFHPLPSGFVSGELEEDPIEEID